MTGPEGAGAYGFRLVSTDEDVVLPDLGALPDSAPALEITWRFASAWQDRHGVIGDALVLSQRGQGAMSLTFDPPAVLGALPEQPHPAAIVHPLLALPVALHAHVLGHGVIHAGAFEAAGAAWIVTGDKHAGKSTVLATLAEAGVPIVTDDLVVLDGGTVLAGPHCVDLRPDAAERFTRAGSIGVVAGNHRFRLPTPAPSAARLPLGGLFRLGWTPRQDVRVADLPIETLLQEVHAQHYAGMLGPPAPASVMALLGAPAWDVTRERTWPRVQETVDALLAAAHAVRASQA